MENMIACTACKGKGKIAAPKKKAESPRKPEDAAPLQRANRPKIKPRPGKK